MAVTQRFEDLSHVVTVKESAVFLGALHLHATAGTPLAQNNGESTRRGGMVRDGCRDKERVLSKILNRAIKVRLVTSRNDFAPESPSKVLAISPSREARARREQWRYASKLQIRSRNFAAQKEPNGDIALCHLLELRVCEIVIFYRRRRETALIVRDLI